MTAKEMFEELGYEYNYQDNKKFNCEDVIIYSHNESGLTIQFNLLSKLVVFSMKNKFKECKHIIMFMTKELLKAINKQSEELGW